MSGVDGAVQGLLNGRRQFLRPLLAVPEHLGPPGGGRRRQAVLVDAQQHRAGQLIHQSHPVVEVGDLLLPQSGAAGVVNGGVPLPGDGGGHPRKGQQVPDPPGDGEVQAALHRAVGGHSAAVLPAVPRVEHNGRAAGLHGRRLRASMCQNGEDTEIQNGRKQHDRHHDLYPFFHTITPYKRMRDKKSIAWIFRFEKVDYAS